MAGLSPVSRAAIYRVLSQHPENPTKLYGYRYLVGNPLEILEGSPVDVETRRVIAELAYPGNGYYVFADLYVACTRIGSKEEKLRLLRSLAQTRSLLVSLRIGPETSVDELLAFWGGGRRTKDIGPLLESLTHVPGGVSLDIAHLLPSLARARLNTFPRPDDPPRDCHWTSMNFWRASPDDRFIEPEEVRKSLESDYFQVDQAFPRFGDVIVLVRPGGRAIHSAIYIAEDVVFTKNGRSSRKPWVLMKMNDVIIDYFNEMSLDIHFYRLREL